MLQLGPPRGRRCTVCTHPREREIATALLAGGSCREVAKRYQIPLSTLARHRRQHLEKRIARAEAAIGQAAQTPCRPGTLEAEVLAAPRLHRVENYEVIVDVKQAVQDLYARTLGVLDRAEASGDSSTMLRAVKEIRNNLELMARLDGSLRNAAPVPHTIEIMYAPMQIGPGTGMHLIEAGG
jgi:transposase-like protein